MLINLRNALMAGKRLPYDAEVEYLESTGTQWIDTGILPVSGIGAKISFDLTGYDPSLDPASYTSNGIIGAENDDWEGIAFSLSLYSYSRYRVWGMVGNGSSSYIDESVQLNTIYSASLNYLNSSLMQINDSTLATISDTEKADCADLTSKIFLFGVSANTGASKTALSICKIYDAVITKGSSVVAHFIPVRKGTTGYLYDRVTRKLFGNAGTGAFVIGPDI